MQLPIDDEHAALYSVGQVARMLGVRAAYVRRLDTEGVVSPARSDGGQRRYSRHEIGTVQRVGLLAAEGISLVGIRRLLELEKQVAHLKQELTTERQRRR